VQEIPKYELPPENKETKKDILTRFKEGESLSVLIAETERILQILRIARAVEFANNYGGIRAKGAPIRASAKAACETLRKTAIGNIIQSAIMHKMERIVKP
jgi:hypothetical protein